MRTPTVSNPPETIDGTNGVLFKIIVKGPGQNAFIRLNSRSVIFCAILPNIPISHM